MGRQSPRSLPDLPESNRLMSRVQPNQRMKLARRGGHFWRYLSVLSMAAAARSLMRDSLGGGA